MKIIEIEATNFCNASCLMCPRDKLTRPKGHMSWETFRLIADKLLAFGQTEAFSFSGIGEPLLNPHLVRFITYVSPSVDTFLTTNGSLLSESTVDALLEAGLHLLILSFNGADAETYERIMVNLDFERAVETIQQLTGRAAARLSVAANVTVSSLTRHQLPAIQQRLSNMGIEHIIYSLCHSRGGSMHDSTLCDPLSPPSTSRCDIFTDTTFVAWDGLALACCQDVAGAAVLGDLTKMPVEELAAIRASILENGVSFPMCPECDDINRLCHDKPPLGATLNEWIYRLYESEDSRTTALTEALRLTEEQLADTRSQLATLEVENARLQRTVAGYERGRFIRLMRWLHDQWDHLLKGRHLRE